MGEIENNSEDEQMNLPGTAGLQTSTSILALQQHIAQELLATKQVLEVRTEELANSISLLNATLESTTDGIVAIDLAGKVISYNTKFAAIWGLPAELLEQRDAHAIMAYAATQVKDSDRFLRRIEELYADPKSEVVDVFELKDGRTFERYVFPQWVNHERVGIVINWREVTERRQAEAALLRSEEKYRLLWATAEDAFILFDSNNTILEANAAVTTIFGYQPREVIGQNLAMLQPERLRGGHRRGIERYLATGIRKINWQAAEVPGLHRDGREIPLEIAFNHLVQDGRHLFAGFIRDISERKQAEAEREILLRKEQAARAEAEIANRAKDEFLATLSHELRTPLTSILGWSHLISDNRLSEEERRRGVEVIQRSAQLQSQLIEDLLDVSRIITGKYCLGVQPTDLSSVIDSAIVSVLPAAQAKGIQIHRIQDSNINVVSGDSARLQQVMWNLLINAIKFTPRGGRVQVHLEHIDSQVKMMVSDTGIGLKPEVVPYVFDRFRQADSTMTRSNGGLGLGLAIVRHIVELHGGIVEAESAGEGLGATFTVTLPLLVSYPVKAAVKEVQDLQQSDTGENVESEDLPELEGLHVLVVDDDDDTRRLIQTILETRQATVTAVTNVPEALEALQRIRPAVLISDLGMPGEDGYSLIRQVRALSPAQGGLVPAAALTAYARAEDRLHVLRSGFQIHLAKPIEPAELIAVVANLADRDGAGPALGEDRP